MIDSTSKQDLSFKVCNTASIMTIFGKGFRLNHLYHWFKGE